MSYDINLNLVATATTEETGTEVSFLNPPFTHVIEGVPETAGLQTFRLEASATSKSILPPGDLLEDNRMVIIMVVYDDDHEQKYLTLTTNRGSDETIDFGPLAGYRLQASSPADTKLELTNPSSVNGCTVKVFSYKQN